jgi:hypothetical protein
MTQIHQIPILIPFAVGVITFACGMFATPFPGITALARPHISVSKMVSLGGFVAKLNCTRSVRESRVFQFTEDNF